MLSRTLYSTHYVGQQYKSEANSTKARLISDSKNVLPTHIEIMAAKIGCCERSEQQPAAWHADFHENGACLHNLKKTQEEVWENS